ncbi:hypothetical protein B0H10DRAFT_1374881 [Mycena sp. CBHHK59/15]|nr:hypothetical protein B0H10DRAFT_1374881 [Mycena sp. CBHHK59/15]
MRMQLVFRENWVVPALLPSCPVSCASTPVPPRTERRCSGLSGVFRSHSHQRPSRCVVLSSRAHAQTQCLMRDLRSSRPSTSVRCTNTADICAYARVLSTWAQILSRTLADPRDAARRCLAASSAFDGVGASCGVGARCGELPEQDARIFLPVRPIWPLSPHHLHTSPGAYPTVQRAPTHPVPACGARKHAASPPPPSAPRSDPERIHQFPRAQLHPHAREDTAQPSCQLRGVFGPEAERLLGFRSR